MYCICNSLSATEAIYFAHRNPELCLHIPAESGVIVGKVYAYQNINDGCVNGPANSGVINYDVIGDNAMFGINSSGVILLKRHHPDTSRGKDAKNIHYVKSS